MKKNLGILALVLSVVLLIPATTFAALNTNKLQTMLDNLVGPTVPGVVIGVDRGGERWIGAAGVADIETGRPLTTGDQVRLASITKTFTAVIAMKLVEEGKIQLTDTVEKWLPGKIVGGDKVTIKMLLNHTAGFEDVVEDEMFLEILNNPSRHWTTDEMVAAINKKNGAALVPGVKYKYSNTGYYILGMVMEAAAGPLDEVIKAKVFAPLNMPRTALTKDGKLTPPYTPGYSYIDIGDGGMVYNHGNTNMSWDWTAGSGVSTASDILNFSRGLFTGNLLSPQTIEMMLTPGPFSPDYGFGVLNLTSPTQGRYYMHSGCNPGTVTLWQYYPESDTAIFFAINFTNMVDLSEITDRLQSLPALILENMK